MVTTIDNPAINEEAFDKQFEAASRQGSAATDLRAKASSVRYDAASKRLVIELQNGITVLVPANLIQGLQEAEGPSLGEVRLMANGTQVHWDGLDVQFYVEDLLKGVFGTPRWMSSLREHLVDIGRLGGSSTSSRKATSSRANGAKGGRPRRKLA